MTFRGFLGGLVKIIKWGSIALVLIYGMLLVINAADEGLAPETKNLLALPQVKADPDNGYLALVGINAPPNEDIFNYGKQWVDTFNIATDKSAIEKARVNYKDLKSIYKGNTKELCDPTKTPCLAEARKSAELWRIHAVDNELLLARQRRLTGYAHFEESYFPPSVESPIPNYATPRLLELDMIALDAAEGRLVPALVALEARIAFDRRALLGARSLLPCLFAANWLRHDYALLAEIVATRSKSLATQKDRLIRMTEPIDIELVRKVAGRMLEGEKRSILRWMAEDQIYKTVSTFGMSGPLGMAGPFLKPLASQNMEVRNHTAMQERLQSFTAENSEVWISQTKQADQAVADAAIYSWRVLYNPIGKFLMTIARMDYGSYVLRLSNLMGVTRLARLQVNIVTDGTVDADILATIAANKALYDPYTGKPMSWDAGKRQLHFDIRGSIPEGVSKRVQAGI
jgi:hypothetical protein